MGNPPMFANIERHIRNIFIGNVPKIPEEKRKQYISSVDMAPTILQASWAYWWSACYYEKNREGRHYDAGGNPWDEFCSGCCQ